MEEGSEDVKFIDAEARSGGKEKISFREIVLLHLKRILTFTSVEFRGGYWEHRPSPDPRSNVTIDVYVPDTREIYSNAIEGLYDVLYPHLDQKTISVGDDVEKELKKAYNDNTIVAEEDRDRAWKKGDSGRVSYRQGRRKIMRKLFRALCVWLKENDYLKGKSFEDEA